MELSQWAEFGLPGSLFTSLHNQSGCELRGSPVTPVSLLQFSPLQAVAMQGVGQRERREALAACSLSEQAATRLQRASRTGVSDPTNLVSLCRFLLSPIEAAEGL